MTLEEMVVQKLADWRPPRDGRPVLNVQDESSGGELTLTVERQEELSCAVWELHVRRGAQASPNELKSWAEQLSTRVTGLLETLHVVEIDVTRNEALLRSQEPTRRVGKLGYYELILRGATQAHVRRFQGSHDTGRREQVPFTLTHEALAKFAADLAG